MQSGRIDTNPKNSKTLKVAAWLGWMIESNWTDPLPFAIYSIIRPIASAAILIVMYLVIRGGDFTNPDFVNIYLGNAFYILVGAIIQGISYGILDDREHYRTLKYIYIAPIRIPVYLIGRGFASILINTISLLITLLFGTLFLSLPIVLKQIDWGLLFISLVLGVVMLTSLGITLGGWILLIRNNVWSYGDLLAAGLFIFSGAVFPTTVLPKALQWVGNILPIGYWLVLMRRAVVPSVGRIYPMYTDLTNGQLLLVLLGFSIIFGIIAVISFRLFDHVARERGNIDMVSNY